MQKKSEAEADLQKSKLTNANQLQGNCLIQKSCGCSQKLFVMLYKSISTQTNTFIASTSPVSAQTKSCDWPGHVSESSEELISLYVDVW